MCGVIVVDAGRSRSTNLTWCLYNDHCMDIVIIIWSSINCPTVICSPTVCYFSWEKALVKPTAPGSLSLIICLCDLFSFAFISYLLNQKYENTLLQFILFGVRTTNIYNSLTFVCPSWGAATRKGLTTPFTRRVASSCYLCAGAVYVVLLGSPIGSITLVSHLREIRTADVLHHPFLFGEIPT